VPGSKPRTFATLFEQFGPVVARVP